MIRLLFAPRLNLFDVVSVAMVYRIFHDGHSTAGVVAFLCLTLVSSAVERRVTR